MVPWVFHVGVTLPLFWFCSSQLLNATLPAPPALALPPTVEIVGVEGFKDVKSVQSQDHFGGGKKVDIGWVEVCQTITSGLLWCSS